MVYSGNFNNISIISLWSRKPKYPEKTTDLSQAIDKLYRILLYRVYRAMNGARTHKWFSSEVVNPTIIRKQKENQN